MTSSTISAGGVVLNVNGEVAVVNQRGRSWSLPKGHVEAGEDLLMSARREIQEETGISSLHYIEELGSYTRYKIGLNGEDDKSELKEIHLFLFTTNEMYLQPTDPHNPEARWVPIEQVADMLTHQKDKSFFLSIKDRIMNWYETSIHP